MIPTDYEARARSRKIDALLACIDRELGQPRGRDAEIVASWLGAALPSWWAELAGTAAVRLPSRKTVEAIVARLRERTIDKCL